MMMADLYSFIENKVNMLEYQTTYTKHNEEKLFYHKRINQKKKQLLKHFLHNTPS